MVRMVRFISRLIFWTFLMRLPSICSFYLLLVCALAPRASLQRRCPAFSLSYHRAAAFQSGRTLETGADFCRRYLGLLCGRGATNNRSVFGETLALSPPSPPSPKALLIA